MLSFIDRKISLKYLVVIILIFTLIFTTLFFLVAHLQKQFILEQVMKQAIILKKQVFHTRQWVTDHQYALVAKTANIRSSPFIKDPDINDVYGKVYTKIAPAMLVRQLSEYSKNSDLYSFNITNFNGLNPENRPDDFEAQAIRLFKSGEKMGISRIELNNDQHIFRYAAPFIVDKSCLTCHVEQNLKPGDIGGCISVTIPMEEAQRAIHRNYRVLFFVMIGLSGSIVLTLFFFTRTLVFKRINEIKKFTKQMEIDELDGNKETNGDELKEFENIFYQIDNKLKNQHKELEKKITEATEDLSMANLKLEEVNKELSNLNRAKTEFFTDISHELRTPLTSIKGAVDILLRKNTCNDPSYLEIIIKNTEYLTRTIVDFLDYCKIEAKRLELEIKDESLPTILRDVIESQKAITVKRGIKFILDVPEDIILPMDRHRIYQVMSNLISNAIRFSPENGTISIGITQKNNTAEVFVQDQGPGIPVAYHETIFQKFYQVPQKEGATKFHKGSSGIGLAICKGLIEAHGGIIRIESKEGAGSKFIFTLPKRDRR